MKKKQTIEKNAVEDVLDQAIGTLKYGLTQLQSEIESIATGKAKANGHDKASRIAFLTAKVGSIADSVRKVEAARNGRLKALTLPMVMAFLRQLDDDDRARVVRELQQMVARGSVLA